MDNQLIPSQTTPTADNRAITHLKQEIASGKNWYIALLEAIALWSSAEETYKGRHYRYLIDGEAFDWLLLAERLCREVGSLLPEEEINALLLHSQSPMDMNAKEFKKLIGGGKYQQHLNYFYGVTVEEVLIQAVQEEIRKEKRTSGYASEENLANEAYRHIYGSTKAVMLKRFRRQKRYPQLKSTSLTELKELSYWLFKYRLQHCDKARVASDTKKALEQLKQNGFRRQTIDNSFLGE